MSKIIRINNKCSKYLKQRTHVVEYFIIKYLMFQEVDFFWKMINNKNIESIISKIEELLNVFSIKQLPILETNDNNLRMSIYQIE